MSQKKAVLKDKPYLVNNLLKSDDIEIRLFSDYSTTCPDCIPIFIECSFLGYQRNLLDPNYWVHGFNTSGYSATSDYSSPLIYNNFEVSAALIKGYYAVKKSTQEVLFYSEFSGAMNLNQHDSFSLELSFSLDKYFYKNPKLLNLIIYINNPNHLYINNALIEIKDVVYGGSSCDDCVKDIMGFNGNFYNNAYFLSINQNVNINASNILSFTVSIIAPGFIDYNSDVIFSSAQNEYILNVAMTE